MADVTVTYKGQNIVELNATGNKTLKTGGKYCEADIQLAYVKSGGSQARVDTVTSFNMTGFFGLFSPIVSAIDITE